MAPGRKVTTEAAAARRKKGAKARLWRKRWWLGGCLVLAIAIALGTMAFVSSRPEYSEPPEAASILAAQEGLRFGILIPAYMPKGFNRENVEIKVDQNGPSGEPAVQLAYRNKGKSAAVFLRQWVPGNPELEVLNGSRPIETRWGTGWLLTQAGDSLSTLWVDIGYLRVAVSTHNLDLVPREKLVLMANTLGLASETQTYTFYNDPIVIKGVEPPPPFEVQLNEEGIQELNLTITPGGYSPIRFAVKKGIPVRINFRALGQVGCGNTLIFPADPVSPTGLTLKSALDLQVLDYTPQYGGDFQFQCTNNCFRGIVTVRE